MGRIDNAFNSLFLYFSISPRGHHSSSAILKCVIQIGRNGSCRGVELFYDQNIIREKYLYGIHGWALNRRLHSGPQCVPIQVLNSDRAADF